MRVFRFTVLTVVEDIPVVKPAFVARMIKKPVSFVALSVHVSTTEFLVIVPTARFEGAAGTTFVGVTLLEAADAGPVPVAFVAVTVKV